MRQSRHWLVGLLAFAGLCAGLIVLNNYLKAVLPPESAWMRAVVGAALVIGILVRVMRRRRP